MSDAGLQVKFDNGTILHGCYYGTSDIAARELTDNIDDRLIVGNDRLCICGNEEKVIVATEYGGGFYWGGTACQKCKCLISGRNTW